jgi:hypothetical protein
MLELLDSPLELVDPAHLLLQLVHACPHRVRRVDEAAAPGQVGETVDRVLARVGEAREQILRWCLWHRLSFYHEAVVSCQPSRHHLV